MNKDDLSWPESFEPDKKLYVFYYWPTRMYIAFSESCSFIAETKNAAMSLACSVLFPEMDYQEYDGNASMHANIGPEIYKKNNGDIYKATLAEGTYYCRNVDALLDTIFCESWGKYGKRRYVAS